mmetsp:Transcript_4104/g.10428  ORF Transcript_4104/g.10428 Transcript_4104/m.10428 type:complete len:229 (-) Transcript_4104:305-991(-)
MPRMITPRRESIPRRSNASLHGSRSSSKSYESRRASQDDNCYGSQFSLRRSSINNRSSQSSSHSFRQQALSRHHQSKQNTEWKIEYQGSASHPPSLVTASDTSIETEESSLSRSSSQSSMQPPSPSLLTTTEVRYGVLRQYYVTRRVTLHYQHPTSILGSPRNQHGLLRASLHPTNRSLPGSPRNSFLPQAHIMEEGTWGQFVDVADAEEELVRRSKLLSINRRSRPT